MTRSHTKAGQTKLKPETGGYISVDCSMTGENLVS